MAWSTNSDRYRGVPKKLAERIRRRDGHRCQRCGQPGHQVDHIVNVASTGRQDDRPANLQTLCDACHDEKTTEEREAAIAAKRESARLPVEQHPIFRSTR